MRFGLSPRVAPNLPDDVVDIESIFDLI